MKVNKIKGGGLVVNQIKQFLESSYAEFPPNNIDNYQLDKNYLIYMLKYILV